MLLGCASPGVVASKFCICFAVLLLFSCFRLFVVLMVSYHFKFESYFVK